MASTFVPLLSVFLPCQIANKSTILQFTLSHIIMSIKNVYYFFSLKNELNRFVSL